MGLYDRFSTDKNLESGSGVLLDFGDDVKICIHRAGGSNQKFKNVMSAKLKPVRQQIDAGTLSDETANRLLAEAYAESVVVAWEGVTDSDGKPLEFTRSNCVKVFLDLPELFKAVQEAATSVANFRREQIAADVETLKNV
jgi:hypothetical protein